MKGWHQLQEKGYVKRTLYLLAFLAAAGLLLLLLFFCYRKQHMAEEPKRIIFVSKIIDENSDFWVQLFEGAKMAAAEYGMEIDILGASRETDVELQNGLVEQAIAQEPDVILMVPASSTESKETVELILDSGIPLVLVDSDVETDAPVTLVATDNVAAGRMQGEYMTNFLSEDSRIAIISHVMDSSTAREREQGLREGLGTFEKNIVDVVFCDSDYDKAYELMRELLQKYPDIDMVAGLNEYSAVGAARAIIDSGAEKGIHLVGFDSSLEEIKLLERGLFQGIVIQNPYTMGYLAVEQAAAILAGETPRRMVDSGSKLITREEVHSEDNQKVLFMFSED